MAELKDVQVKVSKEAWELGQGLVGIVKSIKKAMADGWDTTQDLPVIVMESLAILPGAVQGLDLLDDELKDNRDAFIRAFAISGMEMAGLFMTKEEAEAPAPSEPAAPQG